MDKQIIGTTFIQSLMVLGATREEAESLEHLATNVSFNIQNISWLVRKMRHRPVRGDTIFCLKEPGGTYLYRVDRCGDKMTTMRPIVKTGPHITFCKPLKYDTKPLEFYFVQIPPDHMGLAIDTLTQCNTFAEAIGLRGDWQLGFTYPWWHTFRVASLVAAFKQRGIVCHK